jgi:MFS family permease
MTVPAAALRPWLLRPGPATFGMMFATGAFGRALVMTLIPLEAYVLMGNERNASLMFMSVALVNLLLGFGVPALIHRFRRRRIYWACGIIAAMGPLFLAMNMAAMLPLGSLCREFAGTSLLIVQNLYIMDHIKRRDFVRSEPIRLMFQAIAWGIGPYAGIMLYNRVDPWAAYGVAMAASLAELLYFHLMGIRDMALVAPRAAKPRSPLRFIKRFAVQPRLRLAYAIAFSRSCWWVLLNVYGPIYMVKTGATPEQGGLVVTCGNLMLFSTMGVGWVARRIGTRLVIMGAFALSGCATLATAFAYPSPWAGFGFFVIGALGAVALDAVGGVVFLRAVRARERPEMTMVYVTFIQTSQFIPTAVFAILLTLFDFPVIFVATSALLFWAVWISRHVPRGM